MFFKGFSCPKGWFDVCVFKYFCYLSSFFSYVCERGPFFIFEAV
jgi:hypothetical protein